MGSGEVNQAEKSVFGMPVSYPCRVKEIVESVMRASNHRFVDFEHHL
jgi:hypothetical protein